jgi:hypothetical protein
MKKTIFTIAALIAVTFMSKAQDKYLDFNNDRTDYRERLMFGPKVGLNLSNVYDSQGEQFSADSKLGLALGGFVAIPLGKYIGLQPEMLISQKGFKGKGRLFNSTYQFTRTTTYLDVPIMFAFKPSEFMTFLVGPQYSYLFKQKDTYASGTTTIEQQTAFENDNIRKSTLCVIVGSDLTLKRTVIGIRAAWDVQNNNGNGTSTIPRYKNVWYQLTIGYRF